MANQLRPGDRVRCDAGDGIVKIVRRERGEVLIFFPSIRVHHWIDSAQTTVLTTPQPQRER